VGVDKAGAEIAFFVDAPILADSDNFAALHLDVTRVDLPLEEIDNFAAVFRRAGGSHPDSLSLQAEAPQGCQRALDGETNDIRAATFHGLDDQIAVLLQGVSSRFVENVDPLQICVDSRRVERTETHVRCLVELDLQVRIEPDEMNSGANFVHAARQAIEHMPRFVYVGWFA
jgi:hypothetical protein